MQTRTLKKCALNDYFRANWFNPAFGETLITDALQRALESRAFSVNQLMQIIEAGVPSSFEHDKGRCQVLDLTVIWEIILIPDCGKLIMVIAVSDEKVSC